MRLHPLFVILAALALTLLFCRAEYPPGIPPVHWVCSTENAPWKELPVVTASEATSAPPFSPITLDEKTTYQTMDGFGGCFNDLGWQALLTLDEPARAAALKELFDPSGANFTLGRAAMGANDFALEWYSFDEMPGDYEMKDFSIEHDREHLIPYMKAAMAYQPKLGIWGVPWSPPSWMKTNGAYKGGNMKQDAQTLAAYALYFSKYVQAYRGEGIHLYAIHPQNEPNYNSGNYPQCAWTGEELDGFVRDDLLPQLKKDNVNIEVWFGTDAGGQKIVNAVQHDPIAMSQITGFGYQYGGQKLLLSTHDHFPDKKLAQTETECFNGTNPWDQGLQTFQHIIDDTNHFAGSYFFWNMVLNETGTSTWHWRQNSLLTVDRTTKTVRYNPEFYSMKHFSANVLPGARRIAVGGGPFKDIVAFQNPAGSKVVLFENESSQAVSATLTTSGGPVKLDVPAKSMNTVTLGGG
jgi:glucosylceramidase